MFIVSLANFIKQINAGFELDEWYLSDFIDESVNILSQSDAFEMSSYVVEIIKEDLKSSDMYELLAILLALQYQSGTTQLPMNLGKDPNIFNEIIKNTSEECILNIVNQLARNYRMNV